MTELTIGIIKLSVSFALSIGYYTWFFISSR